MFAYLILRGMVALVAILPFFVLHRLADVLAPLLYHVFRYRRSIVLSNLQRVFPEKTEAERRAIAKKFYLNFVDVIFEGLKGPSLSKAELIERFPVLNPETTTDWYAKTQNRSVIFVGGHYGNWEWGALSPGLQVLPHCVVIFKSVNNQRIHDYIVQSRARFNTQMVATKETRLAFVQHQESQPKPALYFMLSDQYPSNQTDAHEVEFFGRKTKFLHGPAKYAQQYDLPIFFIVLKRIGRSRYTSAGRLLVENPRELPAQALTQIFAQALEEAIREEPSMWLWTHRRWKRD